MSHEMSLNRRATIAMALTIGFYLMALLLACGTIAFPFIALAATGKLLLHLAIPCVVTGWVIFKAVVPRREKFVAPGPLLTSERQPRLFEVIKEVASRIGQPMPESVYLVHEYNAWVAQHEDFTGFGGKWMMGIGLPLLHEINKSQFKAIIAHEFGHYHHGDTKLGPRIYLIRSALERAIFHLKCRRSIAQWPFIWYGNLFLRITAAISRNQEFTADKLSVEVAGKEAAISGLETAATKGMAFEVYWNEDFVPLLEAGAYPPFLKGFELFLGSKKVQAKLSEITAKETEDGTTDEYDSHPSLRKRIDEIKSLSDQDEPCDFSPAMDLIENSDELENDLMKEIVVKDHYNKLKRISWGEEAKAVRIAEWAKQARGHSYFLSTLTFKDIRKILENPSDFLTPYTGKKSFKELEAQILIMELYHTIMAGLILALLENGWILELQMGEDLRFRRGEIEISPFQTMILIIDKEISGDQWTQLCQNAGILDLKLTPPGLSKEA